jgi:hypothetical protein
MHPWLARENEVVVTAVDVSAKFVGVVLGSATCLYVSYQFRTRPALARRRHSQANHLTASTFLILFAAAAWFIALAAGTSGYPDDKDDALVLAGVGLLLFLIGAAFFGRWWRLACRATRRY